MKITLVRGFGKCIECGEITSYQLWVGKMQFYFCKDCIDKLSKESVNIIENKRD